MSSSKPLLRSHFRHLRNQISETERQTASEQIRQHIIDLIKKHKPQKTGLFNEFPHEPIISPLINQLANYQLYLPVESNGQWFISCNVSPPCQGGARGGESESPSKQLANQQPSPNPPLFPNFPAANFHTSDLILIPGLAFTIRGHRLGSGGGIYDRWLANCEATKIGICFHCQLTDHLPQAPHDIPVNYIVDETQIVACHS